VKKIRALQSAGDALQMQSLLHQFTVTTVQNPSPLAKKAEKNKKQQLTTINNNLKKLLYFAKLVRHRLDNDQIRSSPVTAGAECPNLAPLL
jgi:hypothetical protein